MYSLVSATGRIKGANNPWKSLDISAVLVSELFQKYDEVYITLSNPLYATDRILKLSDIPAQYRNVNVSFSDFLLSLNNVSLITQEGQLKVKTSFARYADVVRAGYKIHTIADNLIINSNVSDSDRHHLALTRDNTDYSVLGKNCLAIVNGLIHRMDYNSQMAVIYNGNRHSRNCERYEVGIISFRTVGELLTVPITAVMIGRRHELTPLSKKLYITLDQDYSEYQPMLVFGGYLYPIDPETFYHVSEKTYCLETGKISLLARYMDSREQAGYTVPTLSSSPTNDKMISVSEFLSDEKIIETATALESFFVFVQTDNLRAHREPITRTNIPGTYKVIEENFDEKPLVTGYGLFANYWSVYEDGEYAIKHTLRYQTRYNFLTTDDRACFAVSEIGYSGDPYRFSDCFFLSLASDTVSIETP